MCLANVVLYQHLKFASALSNCLAKENLYFLRFVLANYWPRQKCLSNIYVDFSEQTLTIVFINNKRKKMKKKKRKKVRSTDKTLVG